MMSIEVKRDSWHYWLATCGDRYLFDHQKNICAYTRKMLLGLFLMACGALIAVLALILVGSCIGWFIACVVNLMWIELNGLAAAGLALLGVVLTIFGTALLLTLKDEHKLPKLPPIVSAAWDSFHHKFCAPIEVKD